MDVAQGGQVVKSLRHVVPLLVLLALAALLAGCSKNSTPTGVSPLDEAPPAAPTQIASAPDLSSASVRLVWNASTSANVAGYEVYQYSPDPSRENAYLMIGRTDAATTSLSLPGVSEPVSLTYRLRSVSGSGIRSEWSEIATILVVPQAIGSDTEADPHPGYQKARG
jgi:hypothetical protein